MITGHWTAMFTGRTKGAIGVFYPIVTAVSGEDQDAARLALYDHYEHIQGLRLIAAGPDRWQESYPGAVTRFVVTHRDARGLRTLSHAAQGRCTFETPDAARAWIAAARANNSPEQLRSVFGPVDTFEVCACPCWPGHFDPCGVYFDDDDIVPAGATIYQSKTDGTLWRVIDQREQYNHAAGETLNHTTLRGSDGTEIRLATTDEDEWNDLRRITPCAAV